jgi:nucleotide-binding universal stress UspA family protein
MKLLTEKVTPKVALKNILFATDFSQASTAALPYAAAISHHYDSMIHLVHVVPDGHAPLGTNAPDPSTLGSIYEDAPTEAQKNMQRLARRLKGFPHDPHVRYGKPWEAIAQIIREEKIDLLIVGTHGRTGVGKLVMGSVAEEILRRVSCPVLTIGPHVRSQFSLSEKEPSLETSASQIKFDRILYATDFSPYSVAAAPYAASLAEEFRSRLTMLHVIEQYGEDLHDHPGPIEVGLRKLEELKPKQAWFRYAPEAVIEFGPPADCILEAANERDADLIVLSARSDEKKVTAINHIPWATVHKIASKAYCPVLIVRTEDSRLVKAVIPETLMEVCLPQFGTAPFMF